MGLDWHRNERLELTILESGSLFYSVDARDCSLKPDTLTVARPWPSRDDSVLAARVSCSVNPYLEVSARTCPYGGVLPLCEHSGQNLSRSNLAVARTMEQTRNTGSNIPPSHSHMADTVAWSGLNIP